MGGLVMVMEEEGEGWGGGFIEKRSYRSCLLSTIEKPILEGDDG